jgi:APA family basic amino acid/polyamine antiporter
MSSPPELRRELSLLDSTMINVGSMIGSGIFIVPTTIALYLHSTSLVILVWVVGGVVSLFGALAIAELGALMPRAGGQYVYLREAYGPLWGFLYGWAAFTVIQTASIAAVAVGFATYLGYFFPMNSGGITVVAIASIVLLTAVNCLGVKFGALVQNGFTFLKMAALGLLAVLSFAMSGGSVSNFSPVLPSLPFSTMAGTFGLAMIAVLWSYDGWIEITYVAGEVRNPDTAMHRSLVISTAIVIVLYVLINLAYMYVLPLKTIAQSALVASDTATVILGKAGASFIAVAVIVSMFGANNGFIFTGARIYYALAKEGLFFRSFAQVHPRSQTPVASLVGQGLWSCLLVLSGTFDELITYIVFVSWIFYAMSCGAVFILRKRQPGMPRPYKTWGYPYTPAVFILFALYLVVNTIIENPRNSALGIGLLLLGIPAMYFWKSKGSKQTTSSM